LTGISSARLAASWSIFCSLLEQGSSPAFSAVIAAGQSMAARPVPSLLVVLMKRLVKSARCRNVAWPMSSSAPASSG